MKRSDDRVLTTHIGSLPRPGDLQALLRAREAGEPYDRDVFAERARRAVAESVARQCATGIDIVDDGEQGKASFLTYVNERLGGLERGGPKGSPWAGSREAESFPEFYVQSGGGPGASPYMICVGPITYRGQDQLATDIANLKAALAGETHAEAFIPSISPSNIERWQENRYYKNDEEYVHAIAEAMREEYRAIIEAGFLLQIDDPGLATRYAMTRETVAEVRNWAEARVEALNHALRGLPPDRIRFHTCYSINMGPRIHDMELKDFIDIMLRVTAGAFSFEAANPRHEHEWQDWTKARLAPGTVLIPGVISHTTVLVEHPELVAERIARYAAIVGRENIIAGADCGFASFAASNEMPASIVWAKLEALVEGARRASRRLWRG
jgi:5-methyltetrahydropteroyltriglutamate--homocysteine methyltransferase